MHSAITDSRVNVDLTQVGLSLPRLSPDSKNIACQDMLKQKLEQDEALKLHMKRG